jgi:hypothetical protein
MDTMPLKQLMKKFVNHVYPQNTSHDIPRLVTSAQAYRANLLPRGQLTGQLLPVIAARRVERRESVDYVRLLFSYLRLPD